MRYNDIDSVIHRWAQRHHLSLFTSWAGGEIRSVYVSSKAGECFQIWIDAPEDGHVWIHAAGVESRRDDHPPEDWYMAIDAFDEGLEEAFLTVMAWMLPSERHFPNI
jgi:hypothetical protein